MRILDATAGPRGIWFDKNHQETIYVEIRREVDPQVLADSTSLPFPAGIFDLVVFNPPHVSLGPNSDMKELYGEWPMWKIRKFIRLAFREFSRVLKREGFVLLKWNSHTMKLKKVLQMAYDFKPLFGQKVAYKTKHSSSTYWVCLERKCQKKAALELFA